MKAFSTMKSGALAVSLAAGLLGACAGASFTLPGERTAVLPAGKGLVLFDAPDWDTAARRVQYADNDQRVDYALFRGKGKNAGAQAELVYMERPPMATVAFEFPYTIRDKVEAWNFSKGQAVEWGEAILTRTDLGQVYYRPYRLTAKNQQCFGLSGEWDVAVDDKSLRNTRILFGYYCAAPGVSLGGDKVASLIGGVGLRDMTRRSVVYAPLFYKPMTSERFYRDINAHADGRQDNVRAMELAQGRGVSPAAGIQEFPFRYAKVYSVTDGPDWD